MIIIHKVLQIPKESVVINATFPENLARSHRGYSETYLVFYHRFLKNALSCLRIHDIAVRYLIS